MSNIMKIKLTQQEKVTSFLGGPIFGNPKINMNYKLSDDIVLLDYNPKNDFQFSVFCRII